MKLSKAQAEVVAKMEAGWELGWSSSMDGRVWLQEGGVGKGGQSLNIRTSTATALKKAGVITVTRHEYPTMKYRLAADYKAKLNK